MGSRSTFTAVLAATVFLVGAPAAGSVVSPNGPFDRTGRAAGIVAGSREVPAEALRALEQHRFFHATLILREYLATVKDTTPDEIVLAARAEAGWGDWENVERLLSGRAWLDSVSGGLGWNLLGRSLYEAGRWQPSRQAFTRWLEAAAAAPDSERGIVLLYSGHAAREAGDDGAAIAAYDRAATLLPAAADWITLQAVAALAAGGDTAQVAHRLARIDAELSREWGWRHRVQAFKSAGNPVAALAAAERAAGELSGTRRAEAWVEAGSLRFDRGDGAGARAAFRRAIDAAPGSRGGVDGARMLSEMPGLTAEDHLLIGRTYLRHGNMQRGTAGLQAWLNAERGNVREREHARYDIASAWFGAGRYDDAERVLLGIAQRNNVPSLSADALYLAGRSQYRDGRVTQSKRTFLDVVARHPQSEAAAKAMYLSADLDHDDGNLDRAIERYRKATTLSPDAEEVGLAHMRLGGIAFQRRDWVAARREFDGYRSRYPTGRRYVQATYWSGLAARRAGDDAVASDRFEEVLRLDPFSWYGSNAATLLGRPFHQLPMRASPATDAATAAQVRDALRVIDVLREIEWSDAAGYEVDRVRRRFSAAKAALYSLAEELNARGYTMAGISIGWDLFRRDGGWSDRLLRILYPLPHLDVILAETAERNVDPFLTAALIRQESMFNPGAVSGAGAIGLMQVMPATGQALARQLGLRRFDPDMLKHAELNVHLGTRYLADQLADFDQRLPVVLAAYNAGPHRIGRWREFPEFADDELFAERIPFAETRDYVKIVQNNARIYEALYRSTVEARRRPLS